MPTLQHQPLHALALVLACCAAPVLAAPGAPAAADARVSVYHSDGARQCEGPGESPQAMAARLLQGITVLAVRKGELQGVAVPAVCGGATSSVNVFDIPASDWEKASLRGFKRWTAP